ncbi:MAG: SRPBCC family protein [Asticcacaulis sp.]
MIRLSERAPQALSGRAFSDFEVAFPSAIEIVMFRTFKAPRALVWEMWTRPEHVRRWWGPHGFENRTCEMDLRPGGRFRLDMAAPDGTPCPCEGTYLEVVEGERIVYEGLPHVHPCGSGLPPESRVVITFKDAGKDLGTRVTVHATMLSPEGTQAAIDQGFAIGWADSLERMEEVMSEGRFEIVTSRRFAASAAELFAVFADPEHLKQWWGPDGFTNSVPEFDFREGGAFQIVMHGPDGRDHDNQKRFVEIVENARVVFDHLQPTHQFRMSIDYVPVPGAEATHTDMIWHMDFAPSEHEELLKTFIPQANEQNYDRLEAYLAGRRI